MNRVRIFACQCMMFLGLIAMLQGMSVKAAPVPVTVCDDKCRTLVGPFQAGLADNDKAECWIYDDPVCTNCQHTTSGWNCTGPFDE